jgi:hypothetical protein
MAVGRGKRKREGKKEGKRERKKEEEERTEREERTETGKGLGTKYPLQGMVPITYFLQPPPPK